MIRRATLALAALLVVVPPASAQEPAAEDAQVVGVVVGGDGKPAKGVPVDVDYVESNPFGLVVGLFTLGFGCLVPDMCTAGSNEVGDVTTDGNGRYEGVLPGSYVAGTETDTDWHVTVGRPPQGQQLAGATSTFEFEVNIAVQEAPPLPLWEAQPTVAVDGWRATATVSAPPSGLAQPRISVSTATGGGRPRDGLTTTVDLRSLELDAGSDPQAVFAVATAFADVRVPHANGRTIYHQAASTPTMPVTQVALIPPSRGATCTISRADGTTDDISSCGATDGSGRGIVYDTVSDAETTPVPESVTVNLAAPVDLADVFVYGCDAGCVGEVSSDGVTWVRLTNDVASSRFDASFPGEGYLVASLRPVAPARFVRVTREGGVSVSEISVWPAAPPEPLPPAEIPSPTPPAPGQPGATDAAAASPGSSDDDVSTGTLAVAVLALVVAATGIGVVVGRRLIPNRE